MLLRRLRRAIARSLPKRTRHEVGTGWYRGSGEIQPFDLHPPLMVGARVARRLNFGDSVVFEVSPITGLAERVRVTHRPKQ